MEFIHRSRYAIASNGLDNSTSAPTGSKGLPVWARAHFKKIQLKKVSVTIILVIKFIEKVRVHFFTLVTPMERRDMFHGRLNYKRTFSYAIQ